MRCTRMMLLSMAAVLAACGSTGKDTDATGASGSTATAVTTAPAPTLATIAAVAASSAATITPHVVCYDSINGIGEIEPQTDGFYFGYENTGTEPVVIDEGASNHLDATWADDHPLVPTVFAPGEVAVAFLAVVDTDDPLPSWTIVGPDGQTNTAQVTGDEPECTPELVTPPAADTRDANLEFGFQGLPEGGATVDRVAMTVTLTGLPPTSVCPPGLEPRPPVVQITDGETTVDGATATFTYPVTSFPVMDGTETIGSHSSFSARVIDECAGGGSVSRGWPVNADLEGLLAYEPVCVAVDGTVIDRVTCLTLPATGGVRVAR